MSLLRRAPACMLASAVLAVSSRAVAASPEPEPSELPSWDTEPVAEPIVELEPQHAADPLPPDGNGSTAVGAMLLGGGAVLGTASGLLMFSDSDEIGLWITGATLSSVAIATGIGLLVTGAAKRKRYAPWRLQHDAPPRGTGMFAGGTMALSAGAFGVLLGIVSLRLQDGNDLPYGQVLLSLGSASAVTGIALIVVGQRRGRAFDAWYEKRVMPTIGVLPGPRVRTAGATFGIAGRF
ncbi:MAG TPA: hypothetical protein VM869_22075 [Enhygromyxa sp.]|nr:hypothetical protein [Enhygromyxa sp.]